MLVGMADADRWKSAHTDTRGNDSKFPKLLAVRVTAAGVAACPRTMHHVVSQRRDQLPPPTLLLAVRPVLLLPLPGSLKDDMTGDVLLHGERRGHPQRVITTSSSLCAATCLLLHPPSGRRAERC